MLISVFLSFLLNNNLRHRLFKLSELSEIRCIGSDIVRQRTENK